MTDDPDPLAAWRRAERARLIAARRALPPDEQARVAAGVAAELDRLVRPGPGLVVSLYWPYRGELDLRPWMAAAVAAGARVALPVVEAPARPLAFREWTPAAAMVPGPWTIPVPADGAALVPAVVIAPVVGFDPACYRLGYGGGFYDRTLAALPGPPRFIGVGHPVAEIPDTRPQPHDIPMDAVLTGAGRVHRRA